MCVCLCNIYGCLLSTTTTTATTWKLIPWLYCIENCIAVVHFDCIVRSFNSSDCLALIHRFVAQIFRIITYLAPLRTDRTHKTLIDVSCTNKQTSRQLFALTPPFPFAFATKTKRNEKHKNTSNYLHSLTHVYIYAHFTYFALYCIYCYQVALNTCRFLSLISLISLPTFRCTFCLNTQHSLLRRFSPKLRCSSQYFSTFVLFTEFSPMFIFTHQRNTFALFRR